MQKRLGKAEKGCVQGLLARFPASCNLLLSIFEPFRYMQFWAGFGLEKAARSEVGFAENVLDRSRAAKLIHSFVSRGDLCGLSKVRGAGSQPASSRR